MGRVLDRVGQMIARYLEKPVSGYEPFTPSDPERAARLRSGPATCCWSKATTTFPASSSISPNPPGRMRRSMSGRSTGADSDGEPHTLIEAELGIGVDSAPLSKYSRFHTRVCRPVGLTVEDCEKVCAYAIERIGLAYDLKNITDLMRYLMPLPVPQRWRRRVLALGSSDPTRIICSALIAQAFESVRYPILPKVTRIESRVARRELLEIRHHSLYTPRDFDISPYFAVVKPTIENGFDYKRLHWADLPLPPPVDEADAPSVEAGDGDARAAGAGAAAPRGRDGVVLIRRRDTAIADRCAWRDGERAGACVGTRPLPLPHARRRHQSPGADVLAAVPHGAVKSIGLAILLLILFGIGLQRLFAWLAGKARSISKA